MKVAGAMRFASDFEVVLDSVSREQEGRYEAYARRDQVVFATGRWRVTDPEGLSIVFMDTSPVELALEGKGEQLAGKMYAWSHTHLGAKSLLGAVTASRSECQGGSRR
jgi:hypothetical protein